MCTRCEKGIKRFGESLRYRGVVRKLIKEIKFRGSYDMVAELVTLWIRETQRTQKPENRIARISDYIGWVVTAVPMYGPKKKKRGFNQAELIARYLAKKWELPYVEMLQRVRETAPMYGLGINERAENVASAFRVIIPPTSFGKLRTTEGHGNNQSSIIKQKVILVDDVWTTGATARECVKVLKETGVEEVKIVAICR